jgi:hypothetical protein
MKTERKEIGVQLGPSMPVKMGGSPLEGKIKKIGRGDEMTLASWSRGPAVRSRTATLDIPRFRLHFACGPGYF